MSNILQYKGYRATIVYRAEDCILYGKIEGIKDLVNFQATSTEDIGKEFHCAVDDYLALCAELGKEPDKNEKICFYCQNAFVDDNDKLHCMADGHNHEKTVEDDDSCKDFT